MIPKSFIFDLLFKINQNYYRNYLERIYILFIIDKIYLISHFSFTGIVAIFDYLMNELYCT